MRHHTGIIGVHVTGTLIATTRHQYLSAFILSAMTNTIGALVWLISAVGRCVASYCMMAVDMTRLASRVV